MLQDVFYFNNSATKGSKFCETKCYVLMVRFNKSVLFRMILCSHRGELQPDRGLKGADGNVICLLFSLSKDCAFI